MEKTTKYFKCDYENDTTVEYVNTGMYSMLNISFTSEDPDYGTDTLHYSAHPAQSMEKMAYEMMHEVSDYLDWKDDHNCQSGISGVLRKKYEDYSMSTMIAVERALTEIAKDYIPSGRNKKGNPIQVVTVSKAAEIIKTAMQNGENVRFDFGVEIGSLDLSRCDISECATDPELSWYGIERIENDGRLFGGSTYNPEIILLCGYYGGGNVTMAYFDSSYEEIQNQSAEPLVKAICESAECKPDDRILLETIDKSKKEEECNE